MFTQQTKSVEVNAKANKKPAPPPPLPPKPLNKILMNLNQIGETPARNKSKEHSFRRYFSFGDNHSQAEAEKNKEFSDSSSEKHDALYETTQLDNNDDEHQSDNTYLPKDCTSSIGIKSNREATTTKYSQISIKATPATRINLCYSTNSTTSDGSQMTDNINLDNENDRKIRIDTRIQTHTTKPIVTESPEEANNNNLVKRNRSANISTVEILEVPLQHKSTASPQSLEHINKISDSSYRKNNPTFSRSLIQQQQLFYENNNSYAIPVVTSETDDEEEYDEQDRNETDVELLNEIEVESILNASSNSYPPKTSTPNVSKETDEITNTSFGGGELIGINDLSSDQVNTSRNSTNQTKMPEEMPYSTQLFTDTKVDRINELERLSSSLIHEVKNLKNQVFCLNTKLSELELQVDKQQQQLVDYSRQDNTDTKASIDRSNLNISSMKTKFSDSQDLSKSTSTINKLATNGNNQVVNSSPTSTYSRNNVANITSRSNEPSLIHSTSGYISNSMIGSTRMPSSNSCNNTVTKSSKKFNVHSSTNSLYADSLKSGSASISPTLNYKHYGQTNSPNLYSMTLNPNKRDPLAHTSMLSLSSLGGQSTTSTLKRALVGSVTNLSQTSSQLLNWPSLSDFISSKNRSKDIMYDEEKRLVRMVLYNRIIDMKLPNWIPNNYSLDKVVEPPQIKLKLDWVYGYRGRDCRTNIFYLPTGECVYFVASIVVLYNLEEKTQRHYLGHTDSVKCLAVHPNKLIIASGQSSIQNKRPIVRVWNTVSLATLRVIGFNEDFDRSICCLAFSKNDQGATLAVVDESNEHTITLLDWQRERNWRLAETNSGHEPVLAIDFHPIDKCTLVAVGKSTINFWDTRGMTMTKKTGLFDKYDKPKYVLCLAFNDFGDTITGDSNGNIIIWPQGSNRPKRVIHDVHQGGVFSILAMKDGSYLTGGRDRRIIEWDENLNQTGRKAELPEHCGGVRYITYGKGTQVLIGTLRNSILLGSFETNFILIMQGHAEATTSIAVHPTQNHYLTGGFDNQIHFFSAKTHEVLWSKCVTMPATSACFSPNGLILVVGSMQGKWLVIEALSQEILFTKCDGSGSINCIKFSPDGNFFAMGSSDAHIYVYQNTESGSKFCLIGTCVGHSAPIKEIDWSDDSRYMQTQSMNLELLFWKASNCRSLDDPEIINDLKWSTHNCTLGFNVIGLWSDCIDSALINYCDKSNNESLIVSVSDNGNLNVFKWPTCYDQCLSQKYHGNVEKLDFIKFLPDDSRLIAIGAKNCVTTEWIIDKQ